MKHTHRILFLALGSTLLGAAIQCAATESSPLERFRVRLHQHFAEQDRRIDGCELNGMPRESIIRAARMLGSFGDDSAARRAVNEQKQCIDDATSAIGKEGASLIESSKSCRSFSGQFIEFHQWWMFTFERSLALGTAAAASNSLADRVASFRVESMKRRREIANLLNKCA